MRSEITVGILYVYLSFVFLCIMQRYLLFSGFIACELFILYSHTHALVDVSSFLYTFLVKMDIKCFLLLLYQWNMQATIPESGYECAKERYLEYQCQAYSDTYGGGKRKLYHL